MTLADDRAVVLARRAPGASAFSCGIRLGVGLERRLGEHDDVVVAVQLAGEGEVLAREVAVSRSRPGSGGGPGRCLGAARTSASRCATARYAGEPGRRDEDQHPDEGRRSHDQRTHGLTARLPSEEQCEEQPVDQDDDEGDQWDPAEARRAHAPPGRTCSATPIWPQEKPPSGQRPRSASNATHAAAVIHGERTPRRPSAPTTAPAPAQYAACAATSGTIATAPK